MVPLEPLLWLLLGIGIVLVIILMIVEWREYRQYKETANAVMSFGIGMQKALEQVSGHMNDFATTEQLMEQRVETLEKNAIMMASIMQAQSEVLGLKAMKEIIEKMG